MSLYKDPATTLLGIIERENNITLSPEDYDFSVPVPAIPPEESDASFNTQITITANNPAAPYAGSIDIYYNRLDLADLGRMVTMAIRSPDTATTHDVIPSLNRRFGLNLNPEDLVLSDTVPMTGYSTADLVATPESLGWVGSTSVSVAEGDLDLETYLATTVLGGLEYPTDDTSRPFAQFYSYWRDFSAHHDYLTTLATGDPVGLELTSVLNDVTEDIWVAAGVGEYSLSQAVITYSGPTSENGLANPDYDHIVVVSLDPIDCTAMSGELVIHSRLPDDPYARP